MGRYCYFSNGFAYKFWFGIQNSGFDFIRYYLTDFTLTDELEFSFKFDEEALLEHIRDTWGGQHTLPIFEKYTSSEKDVDEMYDELFNTNEFNTDMDNKAATHDANFCLACIVYLIGRGGNTVSGTYEG
jgi:hypothetical protein